MVTENTLMKFGLTKDENNLTLKEVFKDNIKLKKIHIDIYSENPIISSSESFMLLLRVIEANAMVSNDNSRIILKRDDKYKTHLMNILHSKITECYYKISDYYFEFILNVQNTYYKITVLN